MGNRIGQLGLLVGAACLVVVTTITAIYAPLIATGMVALLLLFAFTRRIDGWRWMLALTMALLVCASSNVPALVDASFYPRYAAVAGLVLWGLCLPNRTGSPTDVWTRVFIAALWVMAGLATLSFAWSVVPMETLQRGVALLLLAALVHVLVRRRWPDRTVMMADLRVVYLVLSASTVVSLGIGLADGTLVASMSSIERFQGLYNNPNMLGIVCALTIPLGWTVYRQSRRHAALLGMVPAAACLLLSQSRTALIAVLVGALWIVLRYGLGRLVRLAAGVTAMLLVAYLFNLLPTIFAAPWMRQFVLRFTDPTGGDLSNGRTQMWQATVDLWWQNRPTLGFGYASRNYLFELASYDEFFGTSVSVVHNSYLQLLLELGLAAVLPLVLLLVAAGRVVLRAPVVRADAGLVWLVVSGLLIQVTESAMFGTGQTYPYVFWSVVAAALLHLPGNRNRADRHAAARGNLPHAEARQQRAGAFDTAPRRHAPALR
ncbi:O-antigen ligase family protein [Micromonospora sp. LH3U1]|uniref:O-antigen ligase family protein n=1 Tax=Micromonospora sp. LH3U1 TaxID=3018339 RepID=UPI00234A2C06|nr:O-antigen ligase family protein [Micromonospora sp. LH3U1]WCN83518.1 O-antigen ligase family protein [Micromonospora sp. LH3U1]